MHACKYIRYIFHTRRLHAVYTTCMYVFINHYPISDDEVVNILLVGASDLRHVLRTISGSNGKRNNNKVYQVYFNYYNNYYNYNYIIHCIVIIIMVWDTHTVQVS